MNCVATAWLFSWSEQGSIDGGVFEEVGLFNVEMRTGEDTDWLAMARHGGELLRGRFRNPC